ncbi:MAG: L,D-transpeptidase family protein [Bradyrhizobium sp.]
MTRVGGPKSTGAAAKLCQIVVFAAAGIIGAPPQAEAALYYWSDFNPGYYYQPRPFAPQRWQKPRRRPIVRKSPSPGREAARPQGPLILAISVDRQRMKVYDANGLFAETPVSTGMKGHPTPMGVFSVIQKHKWHRSNIYSDAPMPYMQRITWSGIAIHAGVVPGYPASHGCIRMPNAFAIKMWNWTRMGARVVIAPGEISPVSFSHPLLAAQRAALQPSDEPQADVPPAAKSDKVSDAGTKPTNSQASLELRPTVGPADGAKSGGVESSASASLRGQTRTANAGNTPAVITDAVGSGPNNENAKPKPAESTAPANKDQGRMPDTPKGASKPDPTSAAASRRGGQIAVLVSRKDSKLYVRQNFAPLFDVPVTVAPDDRPLGTHVFTAQVDRNEASVLHWSVVSMPATSRQAPQRDDEQGWRQRRLAGATETKPLPLPDGPAEALDRLTIPADAMARITEALSTGGSIIVSDHGVNTSETGEGTDFIVPLR